MKIIRMLNSIISILGLIIVSYMLSGCASDSPKTSRTTNIAILMPTTGPDAGLGQRLASMIELGLEDALEGNIKVMTYDIAEESRIPVIINKMKVRGTKLVLGPIFSNNAQQIISQIQPLGITMLTLSNNPALATQNVYVCGHAPMKQAQRMISYMMDKGYKNYIMLLPASKYSREMSIVVANSLQEKEAKLVQSEYYTDKKESIEVAVQNVANIVQSINELEDADTKPVIYITDDSPMLKELVDAIKRSNLDVQAVIVGDDKIDVEYNVPFTYLFTGSLESRKDNVLARARPVIGMTHLNYLDLIAYDIGKITAHTLGQGLEHDQFLARLNSGHIYVGTSGVIKFVESVADRKYEIIKHDAAGYSLLDAAK